MTVLAGDIGATNARFALVRIDGDDVRLRCRSEYESAGYDGLAEVAGRYLEEESGERPGAAVFGVAAPVLDGRARFANLPWEVDRDELSRRIGIPDTRLLNDFEALCHSLPLLEDDGLVELHGGRSDPRGTVAVLGAGTGLGHGYVTRHGGEERVHSSEAGHVDFGPRTSTQDALLTWLRGRHGRASYERVVSGPGLVDIYRFLLDTGRAEEHPETRARLEEGDAAAVVAGRGLRRVDPACERALRIFASAYGAQAGNFALAVQATGGVYLGGGISRRILPALRGEGFLRAFLDKGKMAAVVEEIPVRVITDPNAGLIGAARFALR